MAGRAGHDLWRALGRRLRTLRRVRALTQLELADLADCEVGYISLLERGRRPWSATPKIRAIAAALSVPVEELLSEPFDLDRTTTWREVAISETPWTELYAISFWTVTHQEPPHKDTKQRNVQLDEVRVRTREAAQALNLSVMGRMLLDAAPTMEDLGRYEALPIDYTAGTLKLPPEFARAKVTTYLHRVGALMTVVEQDDLAEEAMRRANEITAAYHLRILACDGAVRVGTAWLRRREFGRALTAVQPTITFLRSVPSERSSMQRLFHYGHATLIAAMAVQRLVHQADGPDEAEVRRAVQEARCAAAPLREDFTPRRMRFPFEDEEGEPDVPRKWLAWWDAEKEVRYHDYVVRVQAELGTDAERRHLRDEHEKHWRRGFYMRGDYPLSSDYGIDIARVYWRLGDIGGMMDALRRTEAREPAEVHVHWLVRELLGEVLETEERPSEELYSLARRCGVL
jgi:transcriptional regulator with XRE-family HTH domain